MRRFPFCILLIAGFFNVSGQMNIIGTYYRTDYPGSEIILNADLSFRFRFNFDLQWDLACGQYQLKGDTLFFKYSGDMFDSNCNSEGINVTDTSGVIMQDAIDKRYRPILALIRKNKILSIKLGDINEPESVWFMSFYYIKAKKGKKSIGPGVSITGGKSGN